MTNNKPTDSQMASSQVASSKLTGLAGNTQMQPGDGQPGLTDSHMECIKLTNRQVANS